MGADEEAILRTLQEYKMAEGYHVASLPILYTLEGQKMKTLLALSFISKEEK